MNEEVCKCGGTPTTRHNPNGQWFVGCTGYYSQARCTLTAGIPIIFAVVRRVEAEMAEERAGAAGER